MLLAYFEEECEYPEFREVMLDRKQQHKILNSLCKHFKVCVPEIRQSHRRGCAGSYSSSYYNPVIKMGMTARLSTLVHEFAHHLDWTLNGKTGHRKPFKRCLKKAYTFAKRYLPKKKEQTDGKNTWI